MDYVCMQYSHYLKNPISNLQMCFLKFPIKLHLKTKYVFAGTTSNIWNVYNVSVKCVFYCVCTQCSHNVIFRWWVDIIKPDYSFITCLFLFKVPSWRMFSAHPSLWKHVPGVYVLWIFFWYTCKKILWERFLPSRVVVVLTIPRSCSKRLPSPSVDILIFRDFWMTKKIIWHNIDRYRTILPKLCLFDLWGIEKYEIEKSALKVFSLSSSYSLKRVPSKHEERSLRTPAMKWTTTTCQIVQLRYQCCSRSRLFYFQNNDEPYYRWSFLWTLLWRRK